MFVTCFTRVCVKTFLSCVSYRNWAYHVKLFQKSVRDSICPERGEQWRVFFRRQRPPPCGHIRKACILARAFALGLCENLFSWHE
jgi:hypothetical protein